MPAMSHHAAVRPETWVDRHGDALYRFALARVGNQRVAEDLVQETFLAALRAAERFEQQSSERTWLISILRRRVADHFRRRARQPEELNEALERAVAGRFTAAGKWRAAPASWGADPAESAVRSEFWDVLAECLSALPASAASALALRELSGLGADEVCKELGVTPTNLWSLLHRARLRLRDCLERKWFKKD